jgi:hypothetical protein
VGIRHSFTRDGGDSVHPSGTGGRAAEKPTGVYELRDGRVRWVPAVDVNRVPAIAGAVVVAFLFARGRTGRRPAGKA